MVSESANPKLRFVVLHHELPESSEQANHWDFMLESDGVLQTWRLDQRRKVTKTESDECWIPCERIEDHRLDYTYLEGPISGDRGSVKRLLLGKYECCNDGTLTLRCDDETWKVRLEEFEKEGEAHLFLRVPIGFWDRLCDGDST